MIAKETISQLCELSCENVAERLGIRVNRHRALCFMHEDHHPSLSFYGSNREHWFCFVCNKGGSAIDLVKEYTDYKFVDACLWLCREFNVPTNVNTKELKSYKHRYTVTKSVNKKEENTPFSQDVAKWLLDNCSLTDQGHDFLFNQRHLNQDVVKKLKIKSIDNSSALVDAMGKSFDINTLGKSGFVTITNGKLYLRLFTPCLIFPYYDQNYELVGLQSRYIGKNADAPRFQFVSSQKTRLFNLPILNNMKPMDDLYISEGITDCLALLSSGKKAVAIPSATILPAMDLSKLRNYTLHMYPDQDEAGKKAFNRLRLYFIDLYTIVKKEQFPQGIKDYSDFYNKCYEEANG